MFESSDPIKIVHIASGDQWAGAEAQLYNLSKALISSNKVKLLVVLLNHGVLEERLKRNGIEVIVFEESQLNSAQILLRLIALLRDVKPKIVHTHGQKENVLGSIAGIFGNNALSLRTVHGAEEIRLRVWQVHKWLFHFLNWFVGRYLQSIIIAVSNDLAQQLQGEFSRQKLCVIQNGIDIDEIEQQARTAIDLIGKPNRIRLAIVGRLVPVKRIDIFLQIAEQLQRSSANIFEFYVFGDGPLRTKLEAMIAELSLQQCVHMIGFQENIAACVAQMNLLYITSDHEGLPINLLEALCLHVPVVAHAVGAIPEVLAQGQCGTLIDNQEVSRYVRAAQDFATNRSHLLVKAELGYTRVREQYSSSRMAKQYLQTYQDILIKQG